MFPLGDGFRLLLLMDIDGQIARNHRSVDTPLKRCQSDHCHVSAHGDSRPYIIETFLLHQLWASHMYHDMSVSMCYMFLLGLRPYIETPKLDSEYIFVFEYSFAQLGHTSQVGNAHNYFRISVTPCSYYLSRRAITINSQESPTFYKES